MIRCFLTGVQIPMESAYVLNRRETRGLLASLNDRVASLRRLIDQFSPLDANEDDGGPGLAHRYGVARRRHRLVCKAVAEAMSPGFPEISLFIDWPTYQGQVRSSALRGLRGHAKLGPAITKLDDKALHAGESLGRKVLDLLDPKVSMSKKVRMAICAAICIQKTGLGAEKLAARIREAALGVDPAANLALEDRELEAVRRLLPQAKLPLSGNRVRPVNEKKEVSHDQPG